MTKRQRNFPEEKVFTFTPTPDLTMEDEGYDGDYVKCEAVVILLFDERDL